jgi:hypothetical protein
LLPSLVKITSSFSSQEALGSGCGWSDSRGEIPKVAVSMGESGCVGRTSGAAAAGADADGSGGRVANITTTAKTIAAAATPAASTSFERMRF